MKNNFRIVKSDNPKKPHQPQSGATLIELLVGITIGLLTIAVAMGALILSRGISGTVSDTSHMQQQASYAFRVIGQQLRQAGSMQLNLAVNKTAIETITAEDLVAFSPDSEIYPAFSSTPPNTPAVSGKDTPSSGEYKISVAYQNYQEAIFPIGSKKSLFRDCLGAQPSTTIIQSQFVLDTAKGELKCAGSEKPPNPQAIIKNVADFQVRYLVQSKTAAATGIPTIQYVNAADVSAHPVEASKTDWGTVFAVEVCLVLHGEERVDMPNGSTYVGCDADKDGKGVKVDMSSTGALPATRKNRLHMAFRSAYQLRSQGRTS